MHTGLFHTPDLERDGKALSHLGLPLSVDSSPYFQIKVAICVIGNGAGPSVLLMAGNHSDEYEGELSRLIRKLDPSRMRGRVTILPLANAPAVMAARRCSPLDGGNLNRAFPGAPNGAPTPRLAHFLETYLFPRHDVVFDIHAGGTSMAHLLCALIEANADASRHEAALSLMQRLGSPFGFVADNGRGTPTSMGAARRAGAIGFSGEFGGGGATTPESMAATESAINNLLLTPGVTETPVFQSPPTTAAPVRLLSLSRQSQAIYAVRRGWFKPAHPLNGVMIRPKVADVIAQGGDVLRELVRRRDAGGLKVCCWTVCLHNTRLGFLHPGAVTRNAFGDPNYYNLCPSNPDARAYVCALVEDVTHAYRPDIVELESPSFMSFAREFHHEKDGVGLTAEDDFALSLCFCESCRAGAAAVGVDVETARRLVVQWIVEACEREVPRPRFPEFPATGLDSFRQFPALHEYLLWRMEPVTSLIAEIRARAHADCRIVLIDLADGWLGGCDLEAIGKVCDGAILCVYGRLPDESAAILRQGKAALGNEKFLGAGLRVFPRDANGAEDLIGQTNACAKAGVDGLNFYNYGLFPARRLDWIRRTLEHAPGE